MVDKSGSNSEPKSPGGDPRPAAVPAEKFLPPLDEEPILEEVTLPKDTPPEIAKKAINADKTATSGGRVIGAILCLAGVVLVILGYSGNVTWKIVGGGISSSVQTGSLGIIILIAGVIVLWMYRSKITIT
jgi:hypothetical protein